MANPTRRRPGPLDLRLLDVAEELLDAQGLEGLSLRRIARRAGVSHGAPLRHYPSLAELLSALAARGFRMLSEAVEKSGAQLPPGAGPLARLAAAGRGYIELAVAKPGLFALMFRPEVLESGHADLVRASSEAFEQLVRLVPRRAGRRLARRARHASARGLRLGLACTVWPRSGPTVRSPSPATVRSTAAIETTLELVVGDQPGGKR